MSMPDWAKIFIPARIQSEGCRPDLESGSVELAAAFFWRAGFAGITEFFDTVIFFDAGILLFMTCE